MIETGAVLAGGMNGFMVEVDTTQNKREYIDTDDHSSKEKKDSNVQPGSAGTPVWAESPPDVSLPGVQPGMVDPLTLRYTVHSFTKLFLNSLPT